MKKNFSYIFIIILLLGSGFSSWQLYFRKYSQKDTANIHLLPKTIGGWESEEMPIDEKSYAILETRNAFVRKYTNKQGEEVFLFIVYSQNNRKVSHPPEICYTGSGASVLSNKPASFNLNATQTLDVRKVLVEYGKTQQVLYYWFKVGENFTPSYWKQQVLIAIKTLMGKPASSALIRLSSTVRNKEIGEQGIENATQVMEKFVPLTMPYIQKYLP